ncbi:AMP-binding protein [Sanguibacter antarcticus]|uniref:AMP-binding enzyme n=1 Tax=Sanguibacter antarcticus TaxID=372484 RepID=A0A2A9E319_9MICO|nr:AMP-binding protein [Sanguibacter antarcticus]PFG33223.1 AMP-binding enzyme [Sanguibacter antarcticus]
MDRARATTCDPDERSDEDQVPHEVADESSGRGRPRELVARAQRVLGMSVATIVARALRRASPQPQIGGTVLDRFARTVAQHPDETALADAARKFTFEALDEVVTTAARGLVSFGVRPGERVAVALPRSADATVLFLGVLRAGAVAVPLDVSAPGAHLAYVLRDSDARLLVTDDDGRASALLGALTTADRDTTAAGRSWYVCTVQDVIGVTGGEVPPPPSPDDLACLDYGTGDGGTPRRVHVQHSDLAAALAEHGGPLLGAFEACLVAGLRPDGARRAAGRR